MPEHFREAFVRTTPFGVLAAFHLPSALASLPDALHQEERAFAQSLPSIRRAEWCGGRLAFRRAAAELGVEHGAVLRGVRGEPLLPAGLTGSISHKKALAVALVARAMPGGGTVGVDLEELVPPRPAIADLALRPEERAALAALPEAPRWERLALVFAVKEAFYKAVHQQMARDVSYHEASIAFAREGTPSISLHLRDGARFETAVHLEPVAAHVLACAQVIKPSLA